MKNDSKRSSNVARKGCALFLTLATWNVAVPFAFVGSPSLQSRGRNVQMKGYRLDWMLEKKDGTMDLQTTDGYFLGEKGFEKSQAAQGLRYRLRPTPQEYKDGIETEGLMQQFGPVKIKFGEAFGGTANNPALRELKKKIAKDGISDPKKLAENEYWLKRYGHKRWTAPYVDQTMGTLKPGLFRGLAAWSGTDPLKEEKGVTWFEATYGKPWIAKYKDVRLEGPVPKEQVEKEWNSGKLLKK